MFFCILLLLGFLSCKNEISGQDKSKNIEAQFKKDSGILVDVRSMDEWNTGHHPKAMHSDWNSGELKTQSMNWDPNKAYYLHCAGGGRSGQAMEYLKNKGFKKVYNLGDYDDVKKLKLE